MSRSFPTWVSVGFRVALGGMIFCAQAVPTYAMPRFSTFKAHPPIHVKGAVTAVPAGMSPAQIKAAYQLPATGGTGTIAIVDAFRYTAAESDLAVFDQQFGLTACTKKNGCLEEHPMKTTVKPNAGWALETALDTEWAHAIAPQAKILLVEAASGSGADLLAAVDYARTRSDVVAVSMSWGGGEFADEATLDSHFVASSTAFFASSGDQGAGVSWPAVSPNVVAVGGTSLVLASSTHAKTKETAWSGSGGGVSAYEPQPAYQAAYNLKKTNGQRAVPDVSFNADPATGFAVFHAVSKTSKAGWRVLGGTSAGAPQWAAIQALGHSVSLDRIYQDKAQTTSAQYFRDITSGSNGDCTYYCTARRHYDYVTGLGSPLTTEF